MSENEKKYRSLTYQLRYFRYIGLRRFLRYHHILPAIDTKSIKVGDKVRIVAVEGYNGKTGVVIGIDDRPLWEDFSLHIRFDDPNFRFDESDVREGTYVLTDEYFMVEEVEKL